MAIQTAFYTRSCSKDLVQSPESVTRSRNSRRRFLPPAVGAHRSEVAFPTDASQGAGIIDGSGFGRELTEREVDRVPLGGEPIAAHDHGTRLIVDVHIGARHTLNIRHDVQT